MENAKKIAKRLPRFRLILCLLSLAFPNILTPGAAASTPPSRAAFAFDPALGYSTYLGGLNADEIGGIAVDSSGAVYVAGSTTSNNFPTVNAIQPRFNGPDSIKDIFVAKLSPSGESLVYSTYLGGNGADHALDIAVDSSGSAYVTGYTTSTDFPTTQGAFRGEGLGGEDAFVLKLNPEGTALVYSTYLGGGGQDRGNGIAVDPSGSAYVTGKTTSGNFPKTLGAVQAALRGFEDSFVVKLAPNGSGISYSTYLGGGGNTDQGLDIAVDAFGQAYVTGETSSTDFPVSARAFQRNFAGGSVFFGDAFVTKLNQTATAFVYSTYFGGSGGEIGHGIAIDGAGSAYIAGNVDSINLPTASAFQPAKAGNCSSIFSNCTDAFVAKLNASGSALAYSTYLGGGSVSTTPFQSGDTAFDIAVDSSGSAYVTGVTGSSDFPILRAVQPAKAGNGDGFVARLSASGSSLIFSSYLGGAGDETANAIALDLSGNVLIAGVAASAGFPLLRAAQASYGGGPSDVFVARLAPDLPRITGVSLSGKRLVVTGENFQPGAVILINGAAQGNTKNDSRNPLGVVFSKKARKNIPAGVAVQIQVKNPDTSVSAAFPFMR
ncbi:MAG TPA: SBBP repeat-containing protein [Blastocatellia bacterium]|nr:SBBP repeat-containing protein [Blastocatellia bacterium]